jgi:hypothetical protein
MAGNDGSQHSDGEELDLTDSSRLLPSIGFARFWIHFRQIEGEVFQKYLKGLIDGEKGSKENSGDFSEAENSRQSDDAGSDHSGD